MSTQPFSHSLLLKSHVLSTVTTSYSPVEFKSCWSSETEVEAEAFITAWKSHITLHPGPGRKPSTVAPSTWSSVRSLWDSSVVKLLFMLLNSPLSLLVYAPFQARFTPCSSGLTTTAKSVLFSCSAGVMWIWNQKVGIIMSSFQLVYFKQIEFLANW